MKTLKTLGLIVVTTMQIIGILIVIALLVLPVAVLMGLEEIAELLSDGRNKENYSRDLRAKAAEESGASAGDEY